MSSECSGGRGIFDSEGKGRRRESGSVCVMGNCGVTKRIGPMSQSQRGVGGCGERSIKPARKGRPYIMESLILAQNERWRRVLSMQVGRQGG